MTRSINPVAVSLLIQAAESLQPFLNTYDNAQEPLDLTGEVQAIDAFMDEREELKARIADQSEALRLARYNDELVTNTLLHTAHYVESLKTKLASVGVTFAPGENGEAVVQVEPFAMVGFLDNALGS